MLKPGTMRDRLYEQLEPAAGKQRITDLRVGLSYVGVKLDNDASGLAAILPECTSRGCTVLKEAGTYTGAAALDVLKYLVDGRDNLRRALGLAVANALVAPTIDQTENREATTLFNLKPGEKVAMVGLFSPLVDRIRATGAILTVIERNPDRLELLSPEEKQLALKNCDVAIITATTLLNNTFEETANALSSPRLVALMGPSTPLMPFIFRDTPVTHLGGAIVADAAKALQIISEGGGTPALRKYLRFINLMIGNDRIALPK